MQDDLNDILTYYGAKGVIDPNRACIMGWSYGGYAAARGASAIRSLELRDCRCWRSRHAADENVGCKEPRSVQRRFQATSEDPEGISTARNTDGEWSPILIVTAKRDARIPMEQAETLVSNLKKSGKVEGRTSSTSCKNRVRITCRMTMCTCEWIDRTYAWLEKYNPAYVASDGDSAPALLSLN